MALSSVRSTRTTGLLLILIILSLSACTTSQKGLFAKKAPHEAYASRLTDAGLANSAMAKLWFTAAQRAMNAPLTISLPYKETGYFSADRPEAAGYLFNIRHGEILNIAVELKPSSGFKIFADLWKPATGSAAPSLIVSADTTSIYIQHESQEDGKLLLRLQPELLQSGQYTVTITTAPLLAFPVPGKANPRIGSFWGDSRDNGSRNHQGIDIFGKFRTPVVAAANGVITSTRENGLGGKVVFLRPAGKRYTLYYAHLDSQIVREGETVTLGDTVGLMGNTGNAKNTPTHLHFGIYTNSGAVDPLPFVNTVRPEPAAITASTELLQQTGRNTRPTSLYASPTKESMVLQKLPDNNFMLITAATGSWYKILIPEHLEGFVESKFVSTQSLRKQETKLPINLMDAPDTAAAVKTIIPTGTKLDILSNYKSFQFVSFNNQKGWIWTIK